MYSTDDVLLAEVTSGVFKWVKKKSIVVQSKGQKLKCGHEIIVNDLALFVTKGN